VKTTVSFHGLLSTSQPAQPNSIDSSIAIYAGGKDPYAPPAQVEAARKEMADAGAHLQITVFADAFHGFTDPDSSAMNRTDIAYDATADRVSWAGTIALLESTIGA
jgi:dienelactone hydrolase